MKAFVNILSIFRIFAAFAIVPLLLGEFFAAAFVLFVAAAATDWLDGFLARKFDVVTKIGGVLDHIGDKFLVANALVMSAVYLQVWQVLLPAVLMLCRELYVSGLREFMGTEKIEMPVPKDRFALGKIKTFVQMASLAGIFLWIWVAGSAPSAAAGTFGYCMLLGGIGGLWLALALALLSAGIYTREFIGNLEKIKK